MSYVDELPNELQEFILKIVDVKPYGNCDY